MDEAWTLQDLIGLLTQRVLDPGDFIRCAAVSVVWKSCFVEYKPPLEPWLMSVEKEDSDVRDFYNLCTGNIISCNLPEVYGRWFIATNYGWVLTVGLDLAIHLLHPLSRTQIQLPSADAFTTKPMIHDREWMRSLFIQKVCLSSDPRLESCVVMVIYSGVHNLAFVRLGDSSWTDVELPRPCYNDLMFFDGKFYALKKSGLLIVCDIDSSIPKARVVVKELPPREDEYPWGPYPVYLVESFGNIFAVARPISTSWSETIDDSEEADLIDYHTTSLEVYKLENNGHISENKWSRVMDLGDCALFLGQNLSMSIPTNYTKEIRSNCIYFTDDDSMSYRKVDFHIGYDQGIFCLNDGEIKKCYENISLSSYTAPSWMLFSSFRLL